MSCDTLVCLQSIVYKTGHELADPTWGKRGRVTTTVAPFLIKEHNKSLTYMLKRAHCQFKIPVTSSKVKTDPKSNYKNCNFLKIVIWTNPGQSFFPVNTDERVGSQKPEKETSKRVEQRYTTASAV